VLEATTEFEEEIRYSKSEKDEQEEEENNLIGSADIYKEDIEDTSVQTIKTLHDTYHWTLTMELDEAHVQFSIYEVKRYLGNINSIFSTDVVDSIVQESFDQIQLYKEDLRAGMEQNQDLKDAPNEELKLLPVHLKYTSPIT